MSHILAGDATHVGAGSRLGALCTQALQVRVHPYPRDRTAAHANPSGRAAAHLDVGELAQPEVPVGVRRGVARPTLEDTPERAQPEGPRRLAVAVRIDEVARCGGQAQLPAGQAAVDDPQDLHLAGAMRACVCCLRVHACACARVHRGREPASRHPTGQGRSVSQKIEFPETMSQGPCRVCANAHLVAALDGLPGVGQHRVLCLVHAVAAGAVGGLDLVEEVQETRGREQLGKGWGGQPSGQGRAWV